MHKKNRTSKAHFITPVTASYTSDTHGLLDYLSPLLLPRNPHSEQYLSIVPCDPSCI